MIKRFDLVRIKTIERVIWVSGPAGRPASPQGDWSVIGNVRQILFLARDETVAQVPVSDVYKVADYSIEKVIAGIRKVRTLKDLEQFKLGRIEDDNSSGGKDREAKAKTGEEARKEKR